eukprot:CAMPEP_0182455360 /NCGR_PEP_ID=MMETSP1319-20130603/1560_1 /TAXON_ID=172717 /ORGANISM="Bolidomonas pacifica, Strain RCC208" /LENGTH=433 /DNA_ID=CAMNT_0024653407 /DNA_START=26 /DNA_END=1323 /DNA_ORIENTATION=+
MSSYKSNISNNKNELFGNRGGGGGGGTGGASSKPTARTATSSSSGYDYSAHKAKQSSTAGVPKCFLTAQQKAKKEKEAMEARDQAKKAMSAGFFSRADPLSAYSHYKMAAECYKATCDFQKEAMMRRSAAQCQMTNEHYSSAASELKLAAAAHSQLDAYSESAEDYNKAAVAWSYGNDPSRSGEMLLSAARELDRGGLPSAASAFEDAVSHFCPDAHNPFSAFRSSPPSSGSGVGQLCTGAFVGEQLWSIARRFSSAGEVPSALYALGAAGRYYEADADATQSLYSAYFAQTVMQLSMGDVVAAERTYMEVHIQTSSYLPTDECRIAEEMIRAMKAFDVDRVEELKRERKVGNMEGWLRSRVLGLGVGKSAGVGRAGGQPKAPVPAPNPPQTTRTAEEEEQDLEDAMRELEGVEVGGGDDDDDDDDDDEIDLR